MKFNMNKIILVDIDGPLADFEAGFLEIWKKKFPGEFFVPLKDRKTLYLTEDYPSSLREKVESVKIMEGFISGLSIVRGSVNALKEMVESGFKVFICSSEIFANENCLTEKKNWINRHFGEVFAKNAIFTKDKTLIKGDFLIDDKPEITGVYSPEWKHIIFDQPFNGNVNDKPRINADWSNWKEAIDRK